MQGSTNACNGEDCGEDDPNGRACEDCDPPGDPLDCAEDDPRPECGDSDTAAPVARCGDAVLDDDEVCDDGLNDGSYGGCMPGCAARAAYCGDGSLDEGEVCDDGINEGGDGGCSANCLARTTACGTPFALWPAICREDLPDVMADFEEPALPSFYGDEVTVDDVSQLDGLPDGSRATIVANLNGTVFLRGADIEYVVADGVSLGRVVFDGCSRCLVRGGGPNARASYLFAQFSEDITVDSMLIKADAALANLAVDLHETTRAALISTVAFSPYSAAMYTERVDGLLIAGSSWASTGAGGINDWGSRFANTTGVVIVDSQIEAQGPQPVLRRAGVSPRHFYLRTTTIDLYYPESTFDLGSDALDTYDHMYQAEPTYYIGNLSGSDIFVIRYGGSPSDDMTRGIYETTDATWFTPPSSADAHLDSQYLAGRESESWRYLLGAPRFEANLSGSYEEQHPGWPVRASRSLDEPLAVANPYAL